MSIKIGVGESKKVDSFEAGKEAAIMALEKAEINECDFCLVFSTVGYDLSQLLKGIREVTKDAPLVGCSGEGIITQSGSNEEIYGVGVMVVKSDEIAFHPVMATNLKESSKKAGQEIGKELSKYLKEKPIALLLFADCLTVNTDELFKGIESSLKRFVPFVGGTSFDNWQFKKTYQFFNDKVLVDSAVAVLVSGDAECLIKVSHGCEPLGIERTVTRAEKNIIYEIDGKSAWDVLQEYVGPAEKDMPFGKLIAHLSFGLKVPKEISTVYDQYIIRTPMVLDEKTGSIQISAEIKTGTKLQLVRRDAEKIKMSVEKVASEIKEQLKNKKILGVVHIDCAGRGKAVLGTQVNEIAIFPLQETLGKDIPWLGFHSGGEIAPIGKRNFFHNYTVVLGVFYQ
ncbi:FIST C-terminal domain-containing protein [Candidatus Parcubacteria bacterium]|nr:FIST C-terminal domain-containing protein [Candidatus Parcubacteria bacterium]